MEQPSSIPVRTSGIPRPTSRLPVLRSSGSQSQLRSPSSTEQLRKKPSISSISSTSRPSSQSGPLLQKKTSRTSLVRSNTPSTAANTGSSRASLAIATRRSSVLPSGAPTRASTSDAYGFKRPIARPPSRQAKATPQTTVAANGVQEEDVLGDLDGFRSASRASSRAEFREEADHALESDTEPAKPETRKSRPSLSDRTIESLAQIPSSPAGGKGRRRSSFFNGDNSMPPPLRPASALGGNRRPTTSDGTPQATPTTPRRPSGLAPRGSMTAPGKRSVSAAVATNPVSTPSKAPSVSRPVSTLKKQPLSQTQNLQNTPKPRPLSNSKTMVTRTPKSRPSLAGAFGQAISQPEAAVPTTPSPSRNSVTNKTPETSRKVSNSSAALREQIAKAKATRRSDVASKSAEGPPKTTNTSSTLREQIAKAKEAARRANGARDVRGSTPEKDAIVPDPAEIAEFDFGLDDPFNQRSKGNKSLLRKRVDAARLEGRLNVAAMGLAEFPEEILNMYKYDPHDATVAWGEVVDLTSIIAADNELQELPDQLFPDVDIEAMVDSDEDEPQFGGVQNLDLHGNILRELPIGLRRLTQLSKLNLSRNKLPVEALSIIAQITSLRELKLADNGLQGECPASLGDLNHLEILDLQDNKLSTLPTEIRELTHLRTLNVSNNQLQALPSELFTSVPIIELIASKNAFSGSFFDVDTVPHLQTLQLSNNSLASLCESGTILLPALKTLNVTANRLSSLPDISSWTSLTTLLVGENKVSDFPEGFFSLQQLRIADFNANDLTKLDERLALMEGLENLNITANPLRERKFLTMPTEDLKRDLLTRLEPVGGDVALDEVATSETGETSRAPSDWKLTPSGTLDLSFQNLSEVDEDGIAAFAESNNIRQLYLQQNYITTIPAVISQLAHLTVLDLSKNNLVEPLSEPIELPKLRELRLNGNKLQSFDPILSYLLAPALQHLNVSNNRISGSLPTLRDAFPELFLLMASDNSISEVNAGSLHGLKIVNLSNNDIEKLEPEIGLHAGTLTSLDVEGNKFRVPNYAILRKGTDAILTWLRDKIPSPTEEFFSPGSPGY